MDQSPPSFPLSVPSAGSCFSSGGPACTGNIYMSKFPTDPLGGANNVYYFDIHNDTMTYTLCACLENSADPDAKKTCNICSAAGIGCSGGPCYLVTQP